MYYRFIFILIPAICILVMSLRLAILKHRKDDPVWTVYALLFVDMLYVITIYVAAFFAVPIKALKDGTLGIIGNSIALTCLFMVLLNDRH